MRDISLVQNNSCPPQPSAEPQGQEEAECREPHRFCFPSCQTEQEPRTLKAPGSATSGSVSSDKMTACTDPCLSFWCLCLFIPPSLYTFPSSCLLVHLSLCFTLPHLFILSFLLSLEQGCSDRLQLQQPPQSPFLPASMASVSSFRTPAWIQEKPQH